MASKPVSLEMRFFINKPVRRPVTNLRYATQAEQLYK